MRQVSWGADTVIGPTGKQWLFEQGERSVSVSSESWDEEWTRVFQELDSFLPAQRYYVQGYYVLGIAHGLGEQVMPDDPIEGALQFLGYFAKKC